MVIITIPLSAADNGFVLSESLSVQGKYIDYAGRAVVTAPLVYGGDGNAPSSTWAGKIVLVNRQSVGTVVPILSKLNNVKSAGGLGIIIANDTTGSAPALSIGAGNTIQFTAISVSQMDSVLLKAETRMVTIQPTSTGVSMGDLSLLNTIGSLRAEIEVMKGFMSKPTNPFIGVFVLPDAVKQGDRITFIASSDGDPAPTFQWSKNGVPITGATSQTYLIAVAQPSDAGDYTVTATNVAGSATSQPSKLVVIP